MAITNSILNCHILVFARGRCDATFGLVFPRSRSSFASVIVCRDEIVDTRVLEKLEDEVSKSGAEHHKKVLILSGAFLEEQISLSAQYLLATGFEVYLLRELILARNPIHAHIHDSRLLQLGAVATTLGQLAYEWTATESDEEIRVVLKNISSGQSEIWRPA